MLPHSTGYFSSGSTQTFAAADVDVSRAHDFSPHVAYELGFKLGLAGRLAGEGDRLLMFNKNLFPIVKRLQRLPLLILWREEAAPQRGAPTLFDCALALLRPAPVSHHAPPVTSPSTAAAAASRRHSGRRAA